MKHSTVICLDQPVEIINTYTEAIQTVDIPQSVGKVSNLWISFAKFYEENEQIDDVSYNSVIRPTFCFYRFGNLTLVFSICGDNLVERKTA